MPLTATSRNGESRLAFLRFLVESWPSLAARFLAMACFCCVAAMRRGVCAACTFVCGAVKQRDAALALVRGGPALVRDCSYSASLLRSGGAVDAVLAFFALVQPRRAGCCQPPNEAKTALSIAALYSAPQRYACIELHGAIVTFCVVAARFSQSTACTALHAANTPPPQP